MGVKRFGSIAPPSVTSMVAPTPAECAAAAAGGSTICASTRFFVPARRRLSMMVLSPVAPDEVASAASVKITGPSIVSACAMARSREMSLPCMRKRSGQILREAGGLGLRGRLVPRRANEHLAAQLGHVGEGIADHDAGRQRRAVALEALCLAQEVAVAAGLGDAFVAAHQRRDDDARDGRLQPVPDDPHEQLAARSPVSAKSTCG